MLKYVTEKNNFKKQIKKSKMKKWFNEDYKFEIEVAGYLRGDTPVEYCRNGEQIGDKYECTYGCPVNKQGEGICSKTMYSLFCIMEAVRAGGDLTDVGGDGKYTKTIVCPDGCVIFKLTAIPLNNPNFYKRDIIKGDKT